MTRLSNPTHALWQLLSKSTHPSLKSSPSSVIESSFEDCAGGNEYEAEHVLWDNGTWSQVLGRVFLLYDPKPTYEAPFVRPLPDEMMVKTDGKWSIEVSNHVQKVLAGVLGLECTYLTRKNKYMLLGNNDGKVESKSDSLAVDVQI